MALSAYRMDRNSRECSPDGLISLGSSPRLPLPLWYAYASFGALLVSALLSLFVNYKQIVLSADQQEYKIQYSYKASMLAKLLCQILAIRYLSNGYVWWLVLEVVFAVVASVALNRVIARTYPC